MRRDVPTASGDSDRGTEVTRLQKRRKRRSLLRNLLPLLAAAFGLGMMLWFLFKQSPHIV